MSGKKELVYWDACIFLAHLKDEKRADPLDMAGVREQMIRIDKAEIQLATSVITLTEVLESGVPTDTRNRLGLIFHRRNCHLVEVNMRIAEISHTIRDYYQVEKSKGGLLPTVTTPDAIHLATAIWFGCDRFYTFDEKDEPKKRRALIPLSPVIAGQYPLIVSKPIPGQLPLEFKT